MNGGYSTTFADLLAEWGHDPSCSSKTCLGCSLQITGTLWPESFTDWPQSATTSDGGLFQQPPLEHPIDASAGGDLPTLKTPTANLGINGGSQHPDKRKAGGHGPTLADEVEHLLPTPTARDHKDGKFTPNVETNKLLGREIWALDSNSTQEPSSDGNSSSVAQLLTRSSKAGFRSISSSG